ncbi:hypothetical protein BC827DRAFT_638787 [Russula dissimulans]|nr:hypothetical protein BC827DRAFT_638787 [Russula dissimulans]
MAVSARLLYLRHAFLLYTFQSLQVLYSTWDPCNMTVHNPLILIRNVVMPRRRMDSQTQHRFSTFRSASNHGLGTRLPHSCSSARWRCNGTDEGTKLSEELRRCPSDQSSQCLRNSPARPAWRQSSPFPAVVHRSRKIT